MTRNITCTSTEYRGACAHSTHVEPMLAAENVAEEITAACEPDLLLAFASGRHAETLGEIGGFLKRETGAGVMLGVSGEGVIAERYEIESAGALSTIALSLPGATLRPFRYQDLHGRPSQDEVDAARAVLGDPSDLRGVLFFADPFSVPASTVVQTLSEAGRDPSRKPSESPYRAIVGGMASASNAPGGNVLVLDGDVMRAGGIGVAISGDVRMDTIVSQGCRPIGGTHVITSGERNLIRTLGGRKAMEVLRETIEGASRKERELLENGLLIGRVVNEYRDRFGRGDFLVRGVMGLDPDAGVVAIGDNVRVGQTVQFHVRDAETASEDLALLLDAEQVRGEALGALLVSCNGRGSRLFDEADHDAQMLSDRLVPVSGRPDVPIAGFFGAGEIGPVGGPSFIHGHTACAAVFREPE